MSLEQLSLEELQEMSMIEIAFEILDKKKQPLPFSQLVDEIVALTKMSAEEVKERAPQFYTDLNIDGRFMNVGGNTWGIKAWYPMDQIEDEIVPKVRSKKKKAKKADDLDDFEIDDDFDEVDEEVFLDEDEDKDLDEVDEDFEDDELIDEDFEDDKLMDDDDDLLIDEDFVDDEERDELDDEFEEDMEEKEK
ncbi:DNA-directed RNA polymerase subunit delta [Fervidibacillus albus]|uniref:Probable DNA-directed RNA polymerase subunit delta n=1 Tax=Fervidibacillus albus TaxID=2980026 RepID=A0A9E8LVN3_9BACI|nr:DNA-directed RNA polymerase subunit delta [Fervidibacillus albus]WAA09639.1 DNA-directed RNA polymerase subunit delta [Fervidibacillus albus]